MVSYTFQELLTPLEPTRQARKLAALSRQVKIEQFLLAEIMFNGNQHFRGLDFYLQDRAARPYSPQATVGFAYGAARRLGRSQDVLHG